MMTRALLPALALPLLAACVVPIPIPVPEGTPGASEIPLTPGDPGDPCGARGLQEFVGQDGSRVLATTFTAPIRVVGPDDVVTMDYQATRVNFRTDAAGIVTAVDCG